MASATRAETTAWSPAIVPCSASRSLDVTATEQTAARAPRVLTRKVVECRRSRVGHQEVWQRVGIRTAEHPQRSWSEPTERGSVRPSMAVVNGVSRALASVVKREGVRDAQGG